MAPPLARVYNAAYCPACARKSKLDKYAEEEKPYLVVCSHCAYVYIATGPNPKSSRPMTQEEKLILQKPKNTNVFDIIKKAHDLKAKEICPND